MIMMIQRASLVSGSISRNALNQTPSVKRGFESALSCRKRFLHTSFAPLVRPFRASLSTAMSAESPISIWRGRASTDMFNRSMQTTSPRLKLSPRQAADLEDRLWKTVASRLQDDVLKKDLLSLQWWTRRIAVSDDGTIQILLKLPSLLHPSLQELKDAVKLEAENEINLWLKEIGREEPARVNVEAIASPPMPMMARLVENPEDLVKELGPGLANVSHFVAVYSCKVCTIDYIECGIMNRRLLTGVSLTAIDMLCSRYVMPHSIGWSRKIDGRSQLGLRTGAHGWPCRTARCGLVRSVLAGSD